ncbi:MAG: CAP domain-containing protein [Chloroflexi bacterium]|nr:CAP domain-containing protein [Chloroflexota bacterium]
MNPQWNRHCLWVGLWAMVIVWLSGPTLIFGEGPWPAFSGCGGVQVPPLNADYEQQVVELVNARRAERGLPPLKRVESLEYAARYHAADMAQDDYFNHDSYDRNGDSLIHVCDTWSRIRSLYDGFANAENIAAGAGDPDAVMGMWMNSSGHRNNILNTTSREIGVGYYEGGSWGRYWVQNFGLRDNVYPLLINAEARWTNSTAVTLYIYGQWSEMRLRNDDDPWGPWRPFQATTNWTLRPQNGMRMVHAEMRQGGQSATASDSIWLYGMTFQGKLYLPLIK